MSLRRRVATGSPSNGAQAHQAIERAVDRIYRSARFASERERVEHLFMLYEKMQTPLELSARGKSKRRRRTPASRRDTR